MIANDVGQPVWTWANDDPYGNNVPNENPSALGNFTCNLRLPGQYFDLETSLHYNYFRDYDSATGRYIQSDPIGLLGSIDTYAYVQNDPISKIDPTGEIGIGGAIYGAISGGTSGFISSGGKWQAALVGGAAGAVVGAFNPIQSPIVGAAVGSFVASLLGQAAANYMLCRDITTFDYSMATISAIGSATGAGVVAQLSSPTRSAFTYAVSLRMGQGNSAALRSLQGFTKGTFSGAPQLAYKATQYPSIYPNSLCPTPPQLCQ